jgi:hypothetical protein
MAADKMKTETMQGADMGGIEQRQLLGQMEGWRAGFGQAGLGFFEVLAEALAHFRGGGLGEGDDQQLIQRSVFLFETMKAARDQGFGFAGARAGHDENIACRFDRLPLGRRERSDGRAR